MTTIGKVSRATQIANRVKLLSDIKAVIAQYPGMTMTVRQIYYRLVASQKIKNHIKSYNKVKDVLTDARLDGSISFDSIEDRTRTIHRVWDHETVVPNAIYLARQTDVELTVQTFQDKFLERFKKLDEYYDLPRWYSQPERVVVMVEKQALQGMFTEVCDDKQVDLLVCKGYPSVSILNQMGKRLRFLERNDHDPRCPHQLTVLYFGDYDPSGLDIDRNVEERLRYNFKANFVLERMAITLDQIDKFSIPPAPAKLTDSRTRGMEEATGEAMQVELDAIDPPDLTQIIEDAIDDHFDQDIYDGERTDELEERQKGIKDWLPGVLK
jgi:hypothetical protein